MSARYTIEKLRKANEKYTDGARRMDEATKEIAALQNELDQLDIPVGMTFVRDGGYGGSPLMVYTLTRAADGSTTIAVHDPVWMHELKSREEVVVAIEPEPEVVAQADPFPPLDRAEVELLTADNF